MLPRQGLRTGVAVPVLPARTLSLTASMFKSKNQNTDNNRLEDEEDELDEAEIEELFQQQIPTSIGEEEHKVFIVHPDVKWGSRKQYLTTGTLNIYTDLSVDKCDILHNTELFSLTAALQMEEAVGLVNTLYNWSVVDKIILSTKTPEKKRIFGKGNFQALTGI